MACPAEPSSPTTEEMKISRPRRSRIIGLVAAYLDNQYYPLVLERLCQALQERGFHVLVFIAAQTGVDVERVLTEILDYQVDGIIMASASISGTLAQRCTAEGVPVVQFNRRAISRWP